MLLKKVNFRNSLIFIIVLLFCHVSVFSKDSPEITLRTPHNTIYVHLAYLQKDNFKPELAAKALYTKGMKGIDQEELAIKLKKVLDVRAIWIDVKDLPENPNYIDSTTGNEEYFISDILPDVYVEKIGEKWYYSARTVKSIENLYAESFPFEIDFLNEYIPDFAYNDFLGVQIWKLFGLVIFFILALMLYKIFYWIFVFIVARLFDKFLKRNFAKKYIHPIARPLSILIVLGLWSIFLPALLLPIQLNIFFSYFIRFMVPLHITIVAFRVSDLVADFIEKLAARTENTLDDNLTPFVRKTLKFIVLVFGLIYILQNIGIEITPLIAGVSIGGLALALAAQDTVKNVFGSITVVADRPFEVGDWIAIDGGEGTVEEVGIRSSRIRTFYDSMLSIPNGKLADMKIDNMGRRQFRRYVTKLGVTYDTSPESIDAFVVGLKDIVLTHPSTRKDYYQIHLNDFSESSIVILFYIFFDVEDWTKELEARHQIISDILRLAKKLDVRFAFNTRTIHIEDTPGFDAKTPKSLKNNDTLNSRLKEFNSDIVSKYGKNQELG